MELKQLMMKRSNGYKQLIEKLELEISAAPEGNLYCKKTGKYYKWYQVIKEKAVRRYIPKNETETAALLARKMINERQLIDARKEKYAVDQYLRHHHEDSRTERFLNRANDEMRRLIAQSYRSLPEQYQIWQNAEYATNPAYTENRRIRTLRGEMVRSKSEAMIADYLYTHGIPYRYECKLCLGDIVLYPDFIILHPVTGEMLLIEHFGMLDDEQYFTHYLWKIRTYVENEYYPDQRLICFHETKEHPLSPAMIEARLSYFLNLES